MSNIQIFNYQSNEVRTVEMGGEPWFVLKDVCNILGISKYRDTAARLDADERGSVEVDTLGGTQQVIAVNESGLYHVILRSDKPEAAPFRKWVTSEVLPTLRKTGSYMMPKMTKEMQAIFLLDNRTAQLDQRVTALENAVNHRVIVDVLGGKNSPAYEDVHVRGRVFCECNKDLQNWFRVNARNNIPRKRFDEAIEYVNRWKPSTNTAMMIQNVNGQTKMFA